jgi:hypothetical protein
MIRGANENYPRYFQAFVEQHKMNPGLTDNDEQGYVDPSGASTRYVMLAAIARAGEQRLVLSRHPIWASERVIVAMLRRTACSEPQRAHWLGQGGIRWGRTCALEAVVCCGAIRRGRPRRGGGDTMPISRCRRRQPRDWSNLGAKEARFSKSRQEVWSMFAQTWKRQADDKL